MVDTREPQVTPVELGPLEVDAPSGRQAPATWGQEFIWEIVDWFQDGAPQLNVCVIHPFSGRHTRDHALQAVQDLIVRHESLRTRLAGGGPGALVQIVDQHQSVPVQILAMNTDSLQEARPDILRWGQSQPPDSTAPGLLRIGIVERDGTPQALVLAASHLLLDGSSVRILRQDLAAALPSSSTADPGKSRLAPGAPAQPADQAAFEHSPAGVRRNSAALEYWERTLRDFPLALPGDGRLAPGTPRYRHAVLHSPGCFDAVRRLAIMTRVTPPTLLLAALAQVLGQDSGLSRYPMLIRTSNRHLLVDERLVGHFAQSTPLLVDLGITDVMDYLRATHRTALNAIPSGHVSQASLGMLKERLARERGTEAPLRITVNHIPPTPQLAGRPPTPTDCAGTFKWISETDRENIAVYSNIWEGAQALSLFVDTAFLPARQVETTLRQVDAFLRRAAAGERDLRQVLRRHS